MRYQTNGTCFCCGSSDLLVYFDLGNTPLANSYPLERGAVEQYPLRVAVCENCFHSQLCESVNPDMLYREYLYVSGTSNTLREYFRWFVSFVDGHFDRGEHNHSVLEIACNDGSLLEIFRESGWSVKGVDPALNLRAITESKELDVLADYWNDDTAAKIDCLYDVIVAQNVLAHLPYPKRFLELCCSVLKEDGIIYIQTSQADMVDNLEFDTIYHEHHSFFSANSMRILAEQAGLKVIGVSKVPVHGTSYLFSLGIADKHDTSLYSLIEEERQSGRYDLTTYTTFSQRANRYVNDFLNVIEAHREEGRKIIGYGAAAKGSTFSSYSKLEVDYIVDDNTLKWEHYTPDGTVKIFGSASLASEVGAVTVVIFAWNFFEEIASRIDQIISAESEDRDFQYVTYFPELKLTSCNKNV